jgi:tripartite-type tricarboxylate transporter receptor subunit TctC
MIQRRRSLLLGAAAWALPLSVSRAEGWTPSRPLRVIIPFTAGGSTDVLVRAVQEPISQDLGQTLVVDNRPGASTIIGTQEVAHAVADGHTMLLVANSFAANISLRSSLPYDSLRDFTPLVRAAAVTNVLLTHSGIADNFADFLSAARKSKAGLSYGSYGIGTTNHLAGEQLCQLAGFTATHVPYNGASRPILDLTAGRIDFLLVNMPDALARRGDNNVQLLAVSSKERATQLPKLPTLSEAGFPDLVADSWFAIVVRSDVPLPARMRLEGAWRAGLTRPEVQKGLEERGFSGLALAASYCAAEIRRYAEVYAGIIKRGNIQVD